MGQKRARLPSGHSDRADSKPMLKPFDEALYDMLFGTLDQLLEEEPEPYADERFSPDEIDRLTAF